MHDPSRTMAGGALMLSALLALSACGRQEAETPVTSGMLVVYEIDAEDAPGADIANVVETIRRRLSEAEIRRVAVTEDEGGRIRVLVGEEEDFDLAKVMIGATGELTFHMVASDDPAEVAAALAQGGPDSRGLIVLPTQDAREPHLIVERELSATETVIGEDGRMVRVLSGEYLEHTSQGFDPQTGEPVVNFTFNTTGAEIFTKLTTNRTRERFAIVLDGEVITAPRILTPITGGSGYIHGNFTIESASNLVGMLNAGALPASLVLIEESYVPTSADEGAIDTIRFADVSMAPTGARDARVG